MSRNQKIKLGSIFVVLVACVWLLWPSLTLMRMGTAEIEAMRINDPQRYNKLMDKSLRLGLDLQGGTYLVLDVDLTGIPEKDRAGTVEQAIQIIRNRVDQFGVSEPSITKEGENRVVVLVVPHDLPAAVDGRQAVEAGAVVVQQQEVVAGSPLGDLYFVRAQGGR